MTEFEKIDTNTSLVSESNLSSFQKTYGQVKSIFKNVPFRDDFFRNSLKFLKNMNKNWENAELRLKNPRFCTGNDNSKKAKVIGFRDKIMKKIDSEIGGNEDEKEGLSHFNEKVKQSENKKMFASAKKYFEDIHIRIFEENQEKKKFLNSHKELEKMLNENKSNSFDAKKNTNKDSDFEESSDLQSRWEEYGEIIKQKSEKINSVFKDIEIEENEESFEIYNTEKIVQKFSEEINDNDSDFKKIFKKLKKIEEGEENLKIWEKRLEDDKENKHIADIYENVKKFVTYDKINYLRNLIYIFFEYLKILNFNENKNDVEEKDDDDEENFADDLNDTSTNDSRKDIFVRIIKAAQTELEQQEESLLKEKDDDEYDDYFDDNKLEEKENKNEDKQYSIESLFALRDKKRALCMLYLFTASELVYSLGKQQDFSAENSGLFGIQFLVKNFEEKFRQENLEKIKEEREEIETKLTQLNDDEEKQKQEKELQENSNKIKDFAKNIEKFNTEKYKNKIIKILKSRTLWRWNLSDDILHRLINAEKYICEKYNKGEKCDNEKETITTLDVFLYAGKDNNEKFKELFNSMTQQPKFENIYATVNKSNTTEDLISIFSKYKNNTDRKMAYELFDTFKIQRAIFIFIAETAVRKKYENKKKENTSNDEELYESLRKIVLKHEEFYPILFKEDSLTEEDLLKNKKMLITFFEGHLTTISNFFKNMSDEEKEDYKKLKENYDKIKENYDKIIEENPRPEENELLRREFIKTPDKLLRYFDENNSIFKKIINRTSNFSEIYSAIKEYDRNKELGGELSD
ncbi:MAG: hypothetical protein CfP315_0239 [Candidatus Improbicoccus pseudotrichonymphae]|uniref:Uncharacterized protein n=1 Tax=Candidatus Improbicoccus pseudotrichonymphae TaxID=3033792 RepID=A0AA48KWV0_9FIRM|nr:MAG: hypothetical protein CfP315_0239 [Candidatus Improbicoccus pseudotrichonymphae]